MDDGNTKRKPLLSSRDSVRQSDMVGWGGEEFYCFQQLKQHRLLLQAAAI